MSRTHLDFTTSTTADPPNGILLSLRRDGEHWLVTDMIGLRFGAAETVEGALAMWADCVQDICDMAPEKQGEPLLNEANRYREALAARSGTPE